MQTAAQIYTDFNQLAELKLKARQDQTAALKATAKQFEALFLEMMLKQMRQASPGDPIFDNDRSRFYREMYDHQLALHLSEQSSIGIADLIVRQLSKPETPVTEGQNLEAYRNHSIHTRPSRGEEAPGRDIGKLDGRQSPPQAGFTASPAMSAPLPGRFETPQHFVQALWPEAQRAAAKIGIDPKLLLAQAALETSWGRKIIHHPDGRSSHNLFNIKAGRSWHGGRIHVVTLEYLDGVAVKKQAAFRAYDDYRQSFDDYLELLQKPRYAEALRRVSDPEGYLRALQQAGYATDPNYADKILAIYRRQTLAAL